MSAPPADKRPHPARPWPRLWFMQTRGYRLFAAREVTSIFLFGYMIFLLVVLSRIGQGYEAYKALLAMLRTPVSVVLHAVVLVAAVLHAITWFELSPRIMPARLGEDKLPDPAVSIGAGYLPWAVVSLVVAWFLF